MRSFAVAFSLVLCACPGPGPDSIGDSGASPALDASDAGGAAQDGSSAADAEAPDAGQSPDASAVDASAVDASVDPCERDHRYGDERCDLDCALPDPDCSFDIIAHRGAVYRRPENTLPAFALAMDQGADAIEHDVCITSDGQVVVWHDRDPDAADALAREAGLEGLPWRPWVPNIGDPLRRAVDKLTLAELRANFGYAHTATGQQDASAVIPTWAELAAWAATSTDLKDVYVDVKLAEDQTALATLLAEQIVDLSAGSRYQLFLMSPHEAIVVQMRDSLAKDRPGHRARFIFDFEAAGALAGARQLGLDALSTGLAPTRIRAEYLAELKDIIAHRDEPPRLDPVVAWTFSEDGDLTEVMGLGVDGIMTDRAADLGRLFYRGYEDHRRLADAVTACLQANDPQPQRAMCADGQALRLFAPLRESQMKDWVCSAAGVSSLTQDLFGCNLLHPKQVVYQGDPEAPGDVAVWYEPPTGGRSSVVVGDISGF